MRRAVLFLACVAGMVFMACGVASAATCEINGGAKYTNDPVVSVGYAAGVGNEFFQISTDESFTYLGAWRPVESPPDIDWEFEGQWSSGRTIFMQFAAEPDGYPRSYCQDSIILDLDAPRIAAKSVTVRRGHVCRLPVYMRDLISPKTKDTVRITSMNGATKKTFVDAWRTTYLWWYWRYRCNLPVGTYRIKVSCADLAGNVAPERTGGWLRVK